MIKKTKTRKRLPAVLGLSIGDRVVHVYRASSAKGTVAVGKPQVYSLPCDFAGSEPEAVGRELRTSLNSAGLRERRCIVAIPAQWILSQSTSVPDGLSPEDTDNFLQLEAEKNLPCDPGQVQMARSTCRAGSLGQYVTQFAVRKIHLDSLAAMLRAAGLRADSYTLGVSMLDGALAPTGPGKITVVLESGYLVVLIALGGALIACRSCEIATQAGTAETSANCSVVAREIRITVEQVPAELRRELREMVLHGESAQTGQLADTLSPWARISDLTVVNDGSDTAKINEQIAIQSAVQWLDGGRLPLEFLPPTPSRWTQLAARYNSKRLVSGGIAVAAVLLFVLFAFAWHELRLWSLHKRWKAMEAQVNALQELQTNIRDYRPWFDTTFHDLSILRCVTECFPDNGSVTAKSIEIHGPATITVSGTARDNTALLHTLDLLRKVKGIAGVKVEQIRGKVPEQFTFSFHWEGDFAP